MPPCLNLLTKKAPYKGLSADSEEKHEPVSDIDTAAADSLKALDPERPIREAEGRDLRSLEMFAVGTAVTDRPPHRTARAEFPHAAFTLGV